MNVRRLTVKVAHDWFDRT